MQPKNIIIGIVILLVLIILIQNTQIVTLHLFFWKIGMSQIVLIPLLLFFGFMVGYFVHSFNTKKKSKNKIVKE